MSRRLRLRAAGVGAALILAMGGSLAAANEPQDIERGRQLYQEKCAMCHAAGGMGAGLLSRRYPKGQELLENRTNLDPAFIATAVRGGIGNMPRIARGEVSDAELALISKYLTRKERN